MLNACGSKAIHKLLQVTGVTDEVILIPEGFDILDFLRQERFAHPIMRHNVRDETIGFDAEAI